MSNGIECTNVNNISYQRASERKKDCVIFFVLLLKFSSFNFLPGVGFYPIKVNARDDTRDGWEIRATREEAVNYWKANASQESK